MAQLLIPRHHTTTLGEDRWKIQWRWPKGAPESVTQDTGTRPSLTFTDFNVATTWAQTFNLHGVVLGYQMYADWLRKQLPPEPTLPATVPTSPAAMPEEPAAAAFVVAVPAPRSQTTGRMQVDDALEPWLKQKQLMMDSSERHRNGLRTRYINYLQPTFGHRWFDEILMEDTAQWVYDIVHGVIPRISEDEEEDAEPLAKKTISNTYSALQQLVAWAMAHPQQTGIYANPCVKMKYPPDLEKARQALFLTPDQLELIITHIREEYRNLIIAAVGTGLRFGEFAALQVSDIHIAHNVIRINVCKALKSGGKVIGAPKTKRGKRWVQIDADTMTGSVLVQQIRGKAPHAHVFTSPTGARLNNGHFHSRGWIPLMNRLRADYPDWTIRPRFHDLRHTAASIMLANDHTLETVSKLLGHSFATCEAVYYHLRDVKGLAATTSVGRELAQLFADRPDPVIGGVRAVIAAAPYEDDEPIADVIDLSAMRRLRRPAA